MTQFSEDEQLIGSLFNGLLNRSSSKNDTELFGSRKDKKLQP
jgi:hypothetical protein